MKAENEKNESGKSFKTNILLTNKNLKYLNFQKKEKFSKILLDSIVLDPRSVPNQKKFLPCNFFPGLWALLYTKNKKELKVIVVYKLVYDSQSGDVRTCTVRDINGLEEKEIAADRIFQIDWPPG